MRRRTFARDLVGTLLMFVVLLVFVIIIIFGENFLDNFKSH
ncbi:MAG TPA: hypothetical protein VNY76_01605 [Candidatus Acidoferrales bacterium]|jgi:hypothetical protein|nr:hypothetical protein [Candidatus Acidoferrales bacterium]